MKLASEAKQGIEIRPAHPDDARDLYEIVSHPETAQTLLQLPSMEFAQTKAWMEKKVPGRHRLVAVVDGKVVGSGAVHQRLRPRMTHSGSLGLAVHRAYWGRGVGTALTKALVELSDNWLNLGRLQLEVFSENEAALRIYQGLGFEIEGRRRQAVFGNGVYHDEFVMARIRGLSEADVRAKAAAPGQRQPPAENVIIRPMDERDTADLHSLWREPATDRTTLQLPSMEYGAALERIETQLEELHRLVAEVDGRAVGVVTLFEDKNPRQRHTGHLGMMVAQAYWGQRIGSRLLEAILDLADNWLNLTRIELEVNTDNPMGIALYQKYGFVIEGTKRFYAFGDGGFAHSHFMARIKE